jgi:regulator of cell morphogenesis and NO signaling
MIATSDTTVRELVAADYRTAALFERYGIDFCCGGCQTIGDASEQAGVDAGRLLKELNTIVSSTPDGTPQFNDWNLGALVDHIVAKHHAYVKDAIPNLVAHSHKIAEVHGGRHEELARVARLVDAVADEMTSHMMKEEHILFPYISGLAQAAEGTAPIPSAPFGSVERPIRMMEAEHESAGHAMEEIRALTGGYRPPADACTTYKVCLEELEAFEKDLHTHVHLENNILFPRAMRIEDALAESA